MKKTKHLFVFSLIASTSLHAGPIVISDISTPYTQDFNTLASSGSSSVLPVGWAFHESGTSSRNDGMYTANTGASNIGDVYSYGASGSSERALGMLRSGTLSPIIGAQFMNDTATAIGSLSISYVGEQWRLGALGREDRLDFQYSLDATSLTEGTWSDFDPLSFVAPVTGPATGALDGNAAENQTFISATITGLDIAPGAVFWLRWLDFETSGSNDGLAIDDFSLLALGGTSPTTVPEHLPSGFLILTLLGLIGLSRRLTASPANG